MQRLCNARLISLWIGILLLTGVLYSPVARNCFAQNPPQIQNQVKVDYKDIVGKKYGTESNIVITPLIILGIDLWGEKQGPKDVIPGETAAYTITYGNSGTQTAYGVKLYDQFPAQMESVIYQNSGYFLNIDPIAKCGTWDIDILPPGTYSFTLSIRIERNTPGSGTIVNAISIRSSSLNEAYLPNNYATVTTSVKLPAIDLWVTNKGTDSIIAGGVAAYTITCGNNGSETAANVAIVCRLSDQAASITQQTSGFPFIWNAMTGCGTWNITSLAPGTTTFELSVKIRDNAPGSTTLINVMQIKYPGLEADKTNNQAVVTTQIIDPDMEIIKSGPSIIRQTQDIVYTIYYRNKGHTAAKGVVITDYLPVGVLYKSDTSGGTHSLTGSGTIDNPQVVRWNPGTITPDSTWQQWQITVLASTAGTINNVVEITTASPETDYSNNRATRTTIVDTARADVRIYKHCRNEKVVCGYPVTYGIFYGNYGNCPAGSVTITDCLPEGLEYAGNTGLGTPTTITGSVTSGGQVISWQAGTIDALNYNQFQITAIVMASGTIHNVVNISTPTNEENYTNNQATCTTRIEQPEIDLWVKKSGPDKINPGYNVIKYRIYYGNSGNIPAGSVTIIDTLPTGNISYATDTSGLRGTQTGNLFTWFVGTIAPNYQGSFELTLTVKDVPGSTTIINSAAIQGSGTEQVYTNNLASVETHIRQPQIDLEIQKQGTQRVLAGEQITYTIQYRNLGSIDAGGVIITDTLPVGVNYAADTSGVTRKVITGTQTQIIWELGTQTMTGDNNWVRFQLIGTVSTTIPASTTLTNIAVISNSDTESNYANNTSACTTLVIPAKADLRVTKQKISPKEVTPGCELIWRIGYDNFYGNVSASNTVITDTLPDGVTFVSCTGNGTLTAAGTVRWFVGTVTKRGSGFYNLTVRVNDTGSATLINTVKITSDTDDLNMADNQAANTVQVVDWYADVRVIKRGPYSVQAGKQLVYTIGYGNNGNISANNTILIDTLPDGVSYATDTSGLSLTKGTKTLSWNAGTLSTRAGYKYFDLYLDVNQDTATITNTIEIKTDSFEKNTANNYSTCTTRVLSGDIDLSVSLYGVSEIASGEEMGYRIVCRNQGEFAAEDVVISDILPDDLIYAGATDNGTLAATGNMVSWHIRKLKSRESREVKLQVRVRQDAPASSTITNIVEVSASNPDSNKNNNQAAVSTHICLPEPSLKIHKWQSRNEVTAGQQMEYRIRYSNEGNGKATNVVITDELPAGISFVSDDSEFIPETIGNTLIWLAGTLPPNQSKDFKLRVAVDKGINTTFTPGLTNVIEISSKDFETKDRDTCTTFVKEPVTDIMVYKCGPDKVLYGTEITYEITYNNNSVCDADDVYIKDTLDPQLEYSTDTSHLPGTISGNEIKWFVGTLTPGASGYFLLKAFVPYSVPVSSILTNTVEITTCTHESKYNNNQAIVTTSVDTPKVDLAIEKKGDDARPGFKKTYHISYYNHGTERAEDVVIIDYLPEEVEYLSSSGGLYNRASHTVTWNIEMLEAQTKGYLTIDVKIPIAQKTGVNLYNIIEIKTDSMEYDYTNNKCIEKETVVNSMDPNDKLVSPQGYGLNNQLLNYTIRFENMATASASAILITITDQLDANLDWASFKWGEIQIGGKVYTLEDFDCGSLTCRYDLGSGTICWEFDFKTGANGLPPNVISPEGEGLVNYSIRTKAGLPSGTEIRNIADIRFDYNPVIETPPAITIIDLDEPVSSMLPLAVNQTATTFAIGWAGTDTAGTKPGEIEGYTVYIADNSGTFTKWIENTRNTAGTVTGKTGHSYAFYSAARDRAGNTEVKSPTQKAETMITIPRHFVLAAMTTTEMLAGGSLTLTVSIYDTEGNPVEYDGTATVRDKLGIVGSAIFIGTNTWTGEVIIPQVPNGGMDDITVESFGIISALSSPFLVLINRYTGGTVTLSTPGVGTTTVRFGTATFIQDFYALIRATSTTGMNIPEGGVINSAREIIAYNMNHDPLIGTFTNLAYLEIPYPNADGNKVVDGTNIDVDSLRVWVFLNNEWTAITDSGVDTEKKVAWCNIKHLTTFMPKGMLIAPSVLGNVIVYPNPFIPGSGHEHITFGSKQDPGRALTQYATIKIFNIAGELVRTLEVTPEDRGQKLWDARNDSNDRVASGIYIYLISNPQGERCVGKLAVIK